jgi:hypothetical protein
MQPLVKFHQFIGSARSPERADRSAGGTLPTRAFRYCEAITSASALGWYIFPPLPFSLIFDGSDIGWNCPAFEGFIPLGRAAQFPYLSAKFDQIAPAWAKGFCPPFLSSLKEPGMVQIWSGLMARTAPDYSLLVRPPVNLPRSRGYEQYEGIVSSDAWFGPLFTNIRLTRTDYPVLFSPSDPLFMAQPVHREALSDSLLNSFEVGQVSDLTERDWQDFRETVVSRNERGCPIGEDAVRRRRRAAA